MTVEDISVIRGTSLAHYRDLVAELGGDAAALLSRAGVPADYVGRRDAFITYRGMIEAVELAAAATRTPDFGRRLGRRQGIDVLGPVGVAARTAGTIAEAFTIFDTYMAAYSPAISARILATAQPERTRFEFRVTLKDAPPCPQVIELSLGVALRVFRFLIDPQYAPLQVHLPHEPLTARAEYTSYFSCRPSFAQRFAGFTIRTADLQRQLGKDEITHQALLEYLRSVVTPGATGMVQPVSELIRQLLPTGAATLELIARQFTLHPKALQRRLAQEGTTFALLVDEVRQETAERYLRDTDLTMSHLARELGYAEQSVLSRSCRRWFGRGPLAQRTALRAHAAVL